MRKTTRSPMRGARASLLLGVFTAAFLCGSAVPATAITINVNSTSDLALGGGGVCPGSPCTLRAAIELANTTPGVDTIVLSPTAYFLNIAGAGEDAAATGDLDLNESTIIQVSGSGTNAFVFGGFIDRVFHIRVGLVTMDRVTVFGGSVTDAPGAGILIDGAAALTYTNGIVQSSTGGGTMSTGGGIAVGTESSGNASLFISSCTITNNSASAGGGGIWVGPNSVATITNCTVSGNTAANGGGLLVRQGSSTTQVTGSTFNNNIVSGSGGAAYNSVCGNLSFRNSTIANNDAAANGGGLFNDISYGCSTNLTVNNTTIAYNRAAYTAGTGSGGGIFQAQAGFFVGNAMVGNSIVAWNEDLDSVNTTFSPDCTNRFDSKGHNLIFDQTGCGIVGSTVGNLPQFSNPNMGLLRFNGGPTNTIALYVGSAAINKGNAFGGAGPFTCEIGNDQRGAGFPRLVGAFCDMGAFEAPICGNFTQEAPEDCDQGPSGGASCDSSCRLLDPVPDHNEPKAAEKTTGYLVTAYQQCTAGSRHTLEPPSPSRTACSAVRSDGVCSFNPSGTPITGTYSIDPLPAGDVRIKVDLKDISCNTQVLTLVASFRETTQNCASSSGIGSCTTTETVWKDLTIGTCTVSGGNCLIDVNINSVPTLPHVASGRRTGLEIQSLIVKRGSVVSFVPGILLP